MKTVMKFTSTHSTSSGLWIIIMALPGEKTIFHVDMDTYFVSVERLAFPRLNGKPTAVGGSSPRSIIASCSYEARALGIHAGMPVGKARRLAPDLQIVSGSHHSYESYTKRIFRILFSFTSKVQPVSIDEGFMDVTDILRGENPISLGKRVQKAVFDETGLWASIGIAENKLLAKMASKFAKPQGVAILTPKDIIDFPIGTIWGLGPQTQKKFDAIGVKFISDLQKFTKKEFESLFGKYGVNLYYACRGIDDNPVIAEDDASPPKSIGNEQTFRKDVSPPDGYVSMLYRMCQKVARRARDQNLAGRTITLRYRLSNFKRKTRAHSIFMPTNNERVLFTVTRKLALEEIHSDIRLIGVCLTSLVSVDSYQREIFGDRSREVNEIADEIRHKYGEYSITGGRTLG